MTEMSAQRIEAAFEYVGAVRRLERQRDRLKDPEFWRALIPELHVTDTPFAEVAPIAFTADESAACVDDLRHEGYLRTRPVVPADRREKIAHAIRTLVKNGFPSGFACVYDEFYQAFQGLQPIFEPILGRNYRWVGHGYWAYHCPPGDHGLGRLGPGAAHRDSRGPDPAVIARELPQIVNLWIPLVDVSTLESCLYVVPAHHDPDFYTDRRDVDPTRFSLQAIRALPADAGSVLSWSTHLAHWGGAATRHARHARMSVTMYFQRADVPPYHPKIYDEGSAWPLHDRLALLAESFGLRGFFD